MLRTMLQAVLLGLVGLRGASQVSGGRAAPAPATAAAPPPTSTTATAACASTRKADVLVIFDRSRSVYAGKNQDGTNNWQASLKFFQELISGGDVVISESGTRVAMASFSEDAVIHFGFNHSYSKGKLLSETEYGAAWKPNASDPDALAFRQTNFGLVVDVLEAAFSDPKWGARTGSDVDKLVFLVTDGSMRVQKQAIYAANNCPLDGSRGVCGGAGMTGAMFERCKACWRGSLATRLATAPAMDGIYAIGIGNHVDEQTLRTFAPGETEEHVTVHTDKQRDTSS